MGVGILSRLLYHWGFLITNFFFTFLWMHGTIYIDNSQIRSLWCKVFFFSISLVKFTNSLKLVVIVGRVACAGSGVRSGHTLSHALGGQLVLFLLCVLEIMSISSNQCVFPVAVFAPSKEFIITSEFLFWVMQVLTSSFPFSFVLRECYQFFDLTRYWLIHMCTIH